MWEVLNGEVRMPDDEQGWFIYGDLDELRRALGVEDNLDVVDLKRELAARMTAGVAEVRRVAGELEQAAAQLHALRKFVGWDEHAPGVAWDWQPTFERQLDGVPGMIADALDVLQ